MSALTDLPNIGKTMESQLNQIGVTTPEQLANLGSKDAWLLIQGFDPSACLLRLMALEGAIQGIKKNDLPDQTKADLKAFYHAHKIKRS